MHHTLINPHCKDCECPITQDEVLKHDGLCRDCEYEYIFGPLEDESDTDEDYGPIPDPDPEFLCF